MIDRPVRYGWGHHPHDEDGVTFENPHDPFGMWLDVDEITDQWRQSAAPDLTLKDDD